MNTSTDTNMNLKLMTDTLVLLMFIMAVILLFQNFQEIEEEISNVVLSSLNDINNSIAETRTGR